ncbi:hypothetical protein KUTeg_023748 [Tegillarca granosa]|uniref:DDE Tnp4 domain-containing protein n=1 Tax=Tegillarca granosa TaxID=220873 RepID=A0ABQ9E2M7_TEGGR|nr:hypothetical protein KUTeg_023748 [Tegillarca granosa]
MEDMAIKILFDDEDDIETNTIFNSSDILSTIACAFHVFPRDKVPRIRQFVEDTIPRFSDGDFRHHFRIDRTTFEIILQHLAPHLLSQTPKGKEQLATDKQLLLFLCILTLSREIIIQWPDPARQNDIAASFQLSCGLPNIIGIIDGTHIRLSAPVIVDDNLLITSAQTGWPGCSHDARILRNSGIFAKAEVGQLIPHNKHIIGDSAYPLKRWLITPFRDNGHLTDRQSRFNRVLSSCRQSVERGIGHLKGRFRRIREVPFHNPEHICLFIIAACKLHNLCIIHEDSIEEFVDFNPAHILHPNQYQNVYPNAADGVARRNHLMNI